MRRTVLLAALGMILAAPTNATALTVTRAELDGGQLRVEGREAAAFTPVVGE